MEFLALYNIFILYASFTGYETFPDSKASHEKHLDTTTHNEF